MVHLLLSLAALGALTTLYRTVGITDPTIVALSLLLIVLLTATVSTRRVAIATSLLAFLCFNFFFIPPVGTLTIADPAHLVALFSLLAVSVIASHLSAQARERAQDATERRDEVARLFDLTRDILRTTDTSGAISFVADYIARRFRLDAVTIWLPGSDAWRRHDSAKGPFDVDPAMLDRALAEARARLEFDARERTYAGHTVVNAGGATGWLVPLRSGTRPIGILALRGGMLEPGARDAIAGVTAIAIERTELLEERKESELVRRGAELKSALLGALGHDLKTPLTAVTVAANNLNATWLTEEERREQAEIVRLELERLNRLFQDIVDMARIETHAVDAEPEWVQPSEIVEAAVRQAQPALEQHVLNVDMPADRLLVRLDPRLTSAALAHLLENAAQYSPAGSIVDVGVRHQADQIVIRVRDRGAGIAPQDLEHLFERFYRGAHARQQRFGTGMGLAITRGLLAAQGGRAWAENHQDRGAVFTIAVKTPTRSAMAVEGELT